jgi:outer membrane murein-binding lipoprotein Lpp
MSVDQFWKVLSIVLGCLVMPLAGWVWTVNVEVAQLRNDLGDLESEVARLEADVEEHEQATRTLIRVESDLGHLREILSRIEKLVAG